MNNGWTLERRRRQAKKIREWKPWAKSTGPKTLVGQLTSSMNAYKGDVRGEHRTEIRRIKEFMKSQRDLREKITAFK